MSFGKYMKGTDYLRGINRLSFEFGGNRRSKRLSESIRIYERKPILHARRSHQPKRVPGYQPAGEEIKGLKNYYAQAEPGSAGAIINSSGALEIFMFKQNARTALSVKRGDVVRFVVSR